MECMSLLFAPEWLHWIDGSGTAGGQQSREECNGEDDEAHDDEGDEIVRGHSVEKTLEPACSNQRDDPSGDEAVECHDQPLAQEALQHLLTRRAECDADPNLANALADDVSENALHADGGENKRKHAKRHCEAQRKLARLQ